MEYSLKSSKKEISEKCTELGISFKKSNSKQELIDLLTNFNTIQKSSQGELKIEDRSFDTIYHLADIHIHVLDRHSEYRKVIDSFVEAIKYEKDKLDKKGLVVICGDIFHVRDKLISETILLFDYFIEAICCIVPIVMIPGNHDTFQNNTKRLDTLTGILTIKKYDNFYYVNEPGQMLHFKGLSFILNVDGHFIKDPIVPNNNRKVALYHGMITGSRLDNNTIITEDSKNSIKLNTFENYDLVLLGDIHKRQFLKPYAAYPGSFIQQNFKEEQDHGYIKWELDTDNVKGILQNVENPYRFVSLSTKIDQYKDHSWSPYSRIKFFIDPDYAEPGQLDEKIQVLIEEVSKYTEVISVSKHFNVKDLINIDSIKEDSTVAPEEQVDKWITDIFLKKSSEETKNSILNLHNTFNTKIEKSNKVFERYTNPWEISSIEFKNMYIYGNDHINKIDFNSMPGIVGIFQTNCSGKTSILNTIIYALFGNSGNSKNTVHNKYVMHKKSKDYYVKLIIKTSDYKYIIERIGKSKRKGEVMLMEEIVFFKSIHIETLKETNLTDSTKNATTEKIYKTLGLTEKDEFLLTNVLSNSIGKSLLTMSNKDIEETFTKLFHIEKYKEIYDDCHQEIKIKNNIYNQKIGEKNILQSSTKSININELCRSIENLEKKVKESKIKKEKIGEDIENINIEIELLPKVNFEITKTEQELKERIIELNKELKEEKEINSGLKDIDIKYIQDYLKENNHLKNIQIPEDFDHDTDLKEIEDKILELLEKKEVMPDSKDLSGECIKAKQFLKKHEKEFENPIDIDLLKKDLEELTKKNGLYLMDQELKEDTLEVLTSVQKQNLQDYYYYSDIINKKKNYDEKMYANVKIDNEILSLKTEKKYIKAIEYKNKKELLKDYEKEQKIIGLQQEREILKRNIKSLEDNKKLYEYKNKKKIIKEELEIIDTEIQNIQKVLTEKKFQEREYKDKERKIDYLEAYLKDLEQELNNLKIYKNIVSDKQLPKLLIKEVIKKVVCESNKIIYSMAGLEVVIEDNLEDNGKWDIYIKKNKLILGTDQISGYERFVVDIGLKIGLDMYKSYSGIKMFFIDEGFDCVSQENLDKIDSLFVLLKQNYKTVLAISHNQEMKKKVNNRILIETDHISSRIIS